MPTFKPKACKAMKICARGAATLDGKHKSILSDLSHREAVEIPKLEAERRRLKHAARRTSSIEKRLDCADKISVLTREIRAARTARSRYWKDNSHAIFAYYEGRTEEGCTTKKPLVLNSFFGKKSKSSPPRQDRHSSISPVKKYLSKQDETFILVDDYLVSTDVCKACGSGELIPVEHEGVLVCNQCATGTSILIENERPSYKEPPKEVCFYAYKRINHFREIVAQFQAKETTQIPDVVLDTIKRQIKKERITPEHLTNTRAKELLKKLGYNKYYEHIPFIKDKLGIRPPVMSPALEDRLCNLFMEIQAPYAKFCPSERVNFLNYYYTVYKLCELLDQTQFLPYFPMLKDREKRIEQDEIWRKICEELNWEFVPTV